VALLACLTAASAQDTAGDDLPVARIGDRTLTRGEFEDWLFATEGRTLVRDFAADQLVLQEAGRRGLLPSDERLEAVHDDEVSRIIQHVYAGDEKKYLADLKGRGYTPETWRVERRFTLCIDEATRALALANRVVTEEQLRQRFHDIYGEGGENRSVEVLFFSAFHGASPGGEAKDRESRRADAHARAAAARARLAAGEAFETLRADSDRVASDFVVDGRVRSYRRNLLGDDVDRALEQLDRPGDISPPVDVWDGAYIVRLASRETVTFEGARAELEKELQQEEPTSAELGAVRIPFLDKAQILDW